MPAMGTLTEPSPARAYNYLLGSKDNFAADREAAAKLETASGPSPSGDGSMLRHLARTNREFLAYAAEWAAKQGITQFLDLGAGLPVPAPYLNIHQAARQARPEARIVYADNDPVVIRHGRLEYDCEGIAWALADMRDTDTVLRNPEVTAVIDTALPVAAVFGLSLHYMDAGQAAATVAGYMSRFPAGSCVILSCARWADPVLWERIRAAYTMLELRNHAAGDLEGFLGGLDLVKPGIVAAQAWRPGWADCPKVTGPACMLAGAGRKV